jgi:hypothetical protein
MSNPAFPTLDSHSLLIQSQQVRNDVESLVAFLSTVVHWMGWFSSFSFFSDSGLLEPSGEHLATRSPGVEGGPAEEIELGD